MPEGERVVAHEGQKIFLFINAVVHSGQEMHVEEDRIIFAGGISDRGTSVQNTGVEKIDLTFADKI